MALALRKSKSTVVSAEDFIGGAPDASKPVETPVAPVPVAIAEKAKRLVGKKYILSVPMAPELVNRLDTWADARGMSRSAAISLAAHQLLEKN